MIISQLQVVTLTLAPVCSAALHVATQLTAPSKDFIRNGKLLSFCGSGKIIFLFHFQMKVEWIPLLLFLFVQIEKVENELSETRLAKQFLINVVWLSGC